MRIKKIVSALTACATTIDELVEEVARRRGRPIHVGTLPTGATGTTGLWIHAQHDDYILYPESAGHHRREIIIAHELGHIVLGHDPHSNGMPCKESMFTSEMGRQISAGRYLARTVYECQDEQQAELFATLIMRHFSQVSEDDTITQMMQ